MATGNQNQNQIQIPEEVPQNLRKRLALAVRTIQWSYAIFWSVSSRQPGLPGRTLAKNQTIWLCNAHRADTKVFSRSLLAKTIVCFPHLGGVVELGTTELVDKVSILDHTIEYLRELERRVEELESHKEAAELGSSTQSKPLDDIERTSDNYGPSKNGSTKKPSTNKRKASEIEKTGGETNRARLRDSSTDNITVTIADKDVLIEMRCSWRECVLLEVMEALSKLHLDTQSVQSSIDDGILSMTVKTKSKGLKTASASVIRQALQRAVRKN
ncbi:UNVERIFIED_CONTAM: Transcription factor GLABRA 3 [Sesamum latifolium]|uniref:Transcription factor GLABRA 3 n=1 Tax=Sesamum latifolium TaxID=2727402 RepID=A0AAW2SN97_9LAMI